MSNPRRAGAFILAMVVLALCLRVAWVCDDAYITFRTIDNWQQGYGPVWNVQERVQSYTHPVWMLLLTVASLPTGELYFTAIAVGLVCSAAALTALLRLDGARTTFPLVLILGLSKAWTEFATSGLENSLSYALLAGAMAALCTPEITRRRQVIAALLLGLAPLCRPDLALIVVWPALLLVWTTRAAWPIVAAGLGPGLSWVAFATVYYGAPLPNTALAKLGHAPLSQNLNQGLDYLTNSIRLDPVLLPVTALGLGVALVRMRKSLVLAAFALGSALYLAYVVSIGGDFMSGRFLTVPFLVAVAALMSTGRRAVLAILPIALILGVLSTTGPLRTTASFHAPSWDDAGIADERGWYYPHLGLLPMLMEQRDPPKPGRLIRAGEARVRMGKAIGMVGYMSGPLIHIVDAYALCDALLARIPSDETLGRPGHWIRPVPRGYLETIKTGKNRLQDAEVAQLWEDVSLATRAPLWAPGRAAAIVRLLTYGRTAPIEGVPPTTSPPQ